MKKTKKHRNGSLLLKKTIPIDTNITGEVQYTYDNAGNVLEEKIKTGDGKYRSKTYEYDFNNNPTKIQQSNSVINYKYNALGKTTEMEITDTSIPSTFSRKTKYEYDNRGNCTCITDPMGYTESYYYDPNNDMTKKTDKNGNVINYTYDGMHRVITTKVTKDGKTQTITNSYGATGGLTEENDGISSKTYTYNELGLPEKDVTKVSDKTYTITKTYDYMGNVSTANYSYYGVKYNYDVRGRLTAVNTWNTSTGATAKLEEYQYDANNNLLKKIEHNGTPNVTYTYNKANMLKTLRQGSMASYDYTYGHDGNVSSIKDNNNKIVTGYMYNGNAQLVKENKRNSDTNVNIISKSYEYDAAGNRTYETYYGSGTDVEIDYEYDKNNRLISESKGDCLENTVVNTSYEYDKNGNRIKKSYRTKYPNSAKKMTLGIEDYLSDLTTDVETYTYDGFNRLTQISKEGGNLYKYAYYPNGLRMSKDVNGNKNYFQWDGDNIWGISNKNNNITHYYYRGLSGNIKDNYGTAYVYNGHGDVVKLTNSSGNVIRNYDYDAFGVISEASNTDSNPWRYCGEYYDVETDNVYLRARYYDTSTGSFITEDPVRSGVNWYSYCHANPVSFIDYSGLDDVIIYTYGFGSKNLVESTFTAQALYMENKLTKQGRDVRMISINAANGRQEFETAWNNLGIDENGQTYELDNVYIYAHGDERALILQEKSSSEALSISGVNRSGEPIGNIYDLKEKNMDTLHLYSCNSGNLDQYFYGKYLEMDYGNVASAFSTITDGVVYGYDGSVGFGPSPSIIAEVSGRYEPRLSNEQERF